MADTNIGANITVDGEISGNSPVVVEGTVKGSIETDSDVVVVDDGVVEADISSEDIEVNGTVNGNIRAANRVEISSNGRMIGDIISPRIHIADGANFKGHIDMEVEE
jgi:cytoskeletal protein CcmA (bactofilin family)